MKILLVEDDVNLREVVQRSLEKERYIVEVAPDFRTGIQKIEDYTYDCICTYFKIYRIWKKPFCYRWKS